MKTDRKDRNLFTFVCSVVQSFFPLFSVSSVPLCFNLLLLIQSTEVKLGVVFKADFVIRLMFAIQAL
ncbi:MAG: hypothetical protein JWP89_2432 [Schlesneria sp.]|nr:hypothetical protein [Schlesneria sp.]